jgi:type IV secretory pathway VirB4 component
MTSRGTRGRHGHRATTAHVQAAYPFVAEGGLGGRGVYIGRDAYGGSFCYDPFELYGRELTSPNLLVAGIVGRAKSSLVKTYLWRQHVFGRRAWVIDVKGEYQPLAAALGVVPIRLRPGGDVRLNPLTPASGWDGQLHLLQSIASGALGRPLMPEEVMGLTEALRAACEAHATLLDEPTLPEVVDILLHRTDVLVPAMVMSADIVADTVRQMAFALNRLVSGDLRGMFDGPTTSGVDFDAPLVVLDLSDVYDSPALPILMACGTACLRAMIRDNGAKLIGVVDEAWQVLSMLGVGEWLQANMKLSRALGQQIILVMHRFADLRAVGAEGSREVRLAEGLLADTETKVIYAQPPDQLPLTRELLGLTDTEAEILPTLRRGEALWKVGRRSFLVHHRLSTFEQALVNTDARMLAGAPDTAGA